MATDDADGAYINLAPEQKLAYHVIVHSLREATRHPYHYERRAAKRWLKSPVDRVGSAEWWASVSDLENVLELCRKLLDDPSLRSLRQWGR
jgi:hypothetical protein